MLWGMWVGSVALVGGLIGLRRGWRRQILDAVGCAAALGLACWQYPRMAPYVQIVWPVPDVRKAVLIYLFTVLYGLWCFLVSQYVSSDPGTGSKRWAAGLVGAVQAGALALLSTTYLLQV
jgi:uncharacterized membrane protein required for colicin V production